jgi:hypothetical protein
MIIRPCPAKGVTGCALVSVLVVLGVGCTRRVPEAPLVAVTSIRSFPPEPASGDTESVYIGGALSFDLVDGLLVVPDQRQTKIHLFSQDGEYLRSFGRYGFGPGELDVITFLRADPDGEGFWVVSNVGNMLIHLTLAYEYMGGFRLPFSGTASFLPLTGGRIVMTCEDGAAQGSLVCLDHNGELVWRASPPLEIAGSRGFLPIVNGSFVCRVGEEIWQVYATFNIIRVFSPEGEMRREFRPQDRFLEEEHAANIERHIDFNRGVHNKQGMLVAARRILISARGGADRCYLVTMPRQTTPGVEGNTVSIFVVAAEGEVLTRFFLAPAPGAVFDIVPLGDGDAFRAALLVKTGESPDQIHIVQEVR